MGIWGEIAILFGPVAPVLFAAVAAAVLGNAILLQLVRNMRIDLEDDGAELSVTYLMFPIVLFNAFAFQFSFLNGLQGCGFLVLMPVLLLVCVALSGVSKAFGRRRQRLASAGGAPE